MKRTDEPIKEYELRKNGEISLIYVFYFLIEKVIKKSSLLLVKSKF